jgi:hypothetical protein
LLWYGAAPVKASTGFATGVPGTTGSFGGGGFVSGAPESAGPCEGCDGWPGLDPGEDEPPASVSIG